jgi:hypothetical protein
MAEIKLGQKVKDATTGFKGIAIIKTLHLNGNVQFGIQPEVEKGGKTYPDAISVDNHLLDVVDDGVSDRITEVTHKTDIVLGNTVEDIASGVKGIVTEKSTYMNGCEFFMVITKEDPKKPGGSTAGWVAAIRLRKVDDGIVEKLPEAKKAESGKLPGGPASRVASRAAHR